MKKRIIFHIDVNNAFLSWTATEMLKNGYTVDIRKKYAIIGGDESKRRGIVLAKSIPCKKKGVTTGEPISGARKKCPYLEVYKPNFNIYKNYSNKMYNYLTQYSNEIERYSIDECFLDYTANMNLSDDPVKLAYKIKEDIKTNLGFTVNVGIGNNKLTAKMASDMEKPDKVHTLFDEEIQTKMWPLKVDNLFMLGRKTAKKIKELHINTIYDLAHTNKDFLIKKFKSHGKLLWEYSNGIDTSKVESKYGDPKSISTSTVLPYNYSDIVEINIVLKELAMDTGKRLRHVKMYASTVFIWIKYTNFEKVSKQIKLENSINSDEDIYKYAKDLLTLLWNKEKIRGLCVGVTNLDIERKVQLTIFHLNKLIKHDDMF